MKKSLFFKGLSALLLGLSLTACQNKELDVAVSPDIDGSPVFYAEVEQAEDPESKVYVDENLMVLWHADDRVSIFNKYTFNWQYRFDGETGANAGIFKKVPTEDFVTGNSIPSIYAVYPYRESTSINNECVLTLQLPASQTYTELSFGPGANTMVSATEDNSLLFKNLGGYLVLKLYGEGVSISSICLEGNNGEKLAGKATVTAPVGGIPSVTMSESGTGQLSIQCPEPVALGATAENFTEFWFVLPPTTFSQGFTVTVTDKNGNSFEKRMTKSLTISRNHLTRMSPIEVEIVASNQPDNEIWYTSTNGEIVEPNNPEAFGANIVSNTYEDGKGVIVFDQPVTKIGSEAFESKQTLATIQIPSSVRTIERLAFFSCYGLTELRIPEGVTTVADQICTYCSSLKRVVFPSTLESISFRCFASCRSLESFEGKFASEDHRCLIDNGELIGFASGGLSDYTLPEGIESIGSSVFENSDLPHINFPSSLRTIESGAFSDCSQLKGIRFPSGLVGIAASAFLRCRSLTEIDIPSSVTSVGAAAFGGCSQLSRITGKYSTDDQKGLVIGGKLVAVAPYGNPVFTVPEGITNIERSTFINLDDLTGVVLPRSLEKISYNAIYWCYYLQTVTSLATTPPTVSGSKPINDSGDFTLYVPAASVDAYKAASGWDQLADRIQPIPGSEDDELLEAVDLGLSVKWANYNVGATKASDPGSLFAWGEVRDKDSYTQSNYKWCDGSDTQLTKYCTTPEHGKDGFVDGKSLLDPEDDAAAVHLGDLWRMPTIQEWEELVNKCEWTRSERDGVEGYQVTSPATGNSIFLPKTNELSPSTTIDGTYWSASLGTTFDSSVGSNWARGLTFAPERYGANSMSRRYGGNAVRAVQGAVFRLNPSSAAISSAAQCFDVEVVSSIDYHIASMPAWVSATGSSTLGLNRYSYSFCVAANNTASARDGVIVFCNAKGNCVPFNISQEASDQPAEPVNFDWNQSFYRHSLFMRFTATWCGYCPNMATSVKMAQQQNPGRIEALNLHGSGSDLYFSDGGPLETQYGITGFPSGIIDGRRKLSNYSNDYAVSLITQYINESDNNYPVSTAISYESTFLGNVLDIDLSLYVRKAGDYKVTVILTESGIVGYQADYYDTAHNDYVHDDIARIAVSNVSGDAFTTDADQTVKQFNYAVTVPDTYNKSQLKILVYVQRAFGSQTVYSDGFGDFYVDNCASGVAGGKLAPTVVSSGSGNNEDFGSGTPINW